MYGLENMNSAIMAVGLFTSKKGKSRWPHICAKPNPRPQDEM